MSRQRDWAAYNSSLVARGDLTAWVHDSLFTAWRRQGPQGRPGPRGYSDQAILTCLVLGATFGLWLRQTEGYMRWLLGATGQGDLPVPDYTTLSWRRRRLEVGLCRPEDKEIFEAARERAGGELVVAVDGTGQVITGPGAWRCHKWGESDEGQARRRWWRVTTVSDVATGQIVGMVAEGVDERAEHEAYGELMDQAADELGLPIDKSAADGAYDNRTCYGAALARGINLVTPPQANATFHLRKARGRRGKLNAEPGWAGRNRRLASRLRTGGDKAWKAEEGYGRRSLSETVFSRASFAFGDKLWSKSRQARKAEVTIGYMLLNAWRAAEITLAGGYTSFEAR